MNFDEAVRTHSDWKSRLRQYVSHPDRSLDVATVTSDQRCDLGKWLSDEGKLYSSMPEFLKLKTDHARFHRAAGDVIRRADSGAKVTEEMALGAHSEFADASGAVVSAIMAMKHKVAHP